MFSLKSKKIVLGVSGGIAAYKSAELTRLLKKAGCDVKVIMTDSAKEFISTLTFQTLSCNRVYDNMFDCSQEFNVEHIELARWADIILIAPATANIIGKIANGIADDPLSTVSMAYRGKIAFAPAMNCAMWENPAVRKNVDMLKSRGHSFIGPASGEQACGETGFGRMEEPVEIVTQLERELTDKPFQNRKIMITAGPTRESIDPARFISNESSGKMGYAIAEAAYNLGADVTLITGPVCLKAPHGITVLKVISACEMHKCAMDNIKEIDIFIGAAAVADYRPEKVQDNKIKRKNETLELKLIKNPDVLKSVSTLAEPPFTVGFSAETENLHGNALNKLLDKKIDMIAANLVGKEKGFNSDSNELLILTRNNSIARLLTFKDKKELAYELMLCVLENINIKDTLNSEI